MQIGRSIGLLQIAEHFLSSPVSIVSGIPPAYRFDVSNGSGGMYLLARWVKCLPDDGTFHYLCVPLKTSICCSLLYLIRRSTLFVTLK